jgi:hypothetical protein
LRRAVAAWKPQLAAGRTPAEVVRGCRIFPETFANLYASGEVSGKLDESLRRLYSPIINEEGTRKLFALRAPGRRDWHLSASSPPIIAYKIIQFYTGYFNAALNTGFEFHFARIKGFRQLTSPHDPDRNPRRRGTAPARIPRRARQNFSRPRRRLSRCRAAWPTRLSRMRRSKARSATRRRS